MPSSRKLVRVVAAGSCGALVGALGPALLLLALVVVYGPTGDLTVRLVAGVVGLFGILPGLANGLAGGWYRLRRSADGIGPVVELLPMTMPALAWALDRDDPKVGITICFSLVPMATVWFAGLVGYAVAGYRS